MAIKTVVTRGFGNGTFNGTIALVVTRGFTQAAVTLWAKESAAAAGTWVEEGAGAAGTWTEESAL